MSRKEEINSSRSVLEGIDWKKIYFPLVSGGLSLGLTSPQLQEQVGEELDRTTAFTSRLLFSSEVQIDHVVTNI